jgi:hypothetical protein
VVEALLALWQQPPADDDAAAQAFAEFYTDPVPINGTPTSCAGLVARARALNRAFDGVSRTLVERVEAPGRLVFAFRMTGTHVGPLATALGEVAPTGREFSVLTIDVLTVTGGLISDVVVVSDELGLLTGLDAVTLKSGNDAG